MARDRGRIAAGMITALGLCLAAGCGGRLPDDIGVEQGRLTPCPKSPNCVSSFETDETHQIDAFRVAQSSHEAWAGLLAELEGRERVEIARVELGYIHAVFTSPLMRYRDDVEFLLRASEGEIAVRSASRIGYGDMGANRNRIESIRRALAARDIVMSASDD